VRERGGGTRWNVAGEPAETGRREPFDVVAALRGSFARVSLSPAERRAHYRRQSHRLLPLFRFILLVGGLTFLGFAGWDYLLGGGESVARALPLRLAFTALLVGVWFASFDHRVAGHWPWLWSGLVTAVTVATGIVIGLVPDGFDKGPAGLLYASAANVLIAPVLGLALLNYAIVPIVGLAVLALMGAPAPALANAAYLLVTFSLLFGVVSFWIDQGRQRNLLLEQALEREQAKRDALLDAVLPPGIAERLHAGESPIADAVPSASVVFVDVVGYSRLTRELPPADLVNLLGQAFAILDFLAGEEGLAKIKTNGDAYVAAAGVADAEAAGPLEATRFAVAARLALRDLGERLGRDLDVHAGIATGPVTAGVIGEARPQFDLWGQTVNNASRLQAAAPPGAIQLDATTAAAVAGAFTLEHVGPTSYRGIGVVDVSRLVD
jgi:class 3 adenylate cyclase